MPAFPPTAPPGLTMQDLACPETDAVAALLAVPELAALLTSNAGTPGVGEPAIESRIYLGRAPMSSNKGKVTRPYIVIRRTGVELQNGGGRSGASSLVMYAPTVEITIVSEHYHALIWMQNKVLMTLNQYQGPTCRSFEFQAMQFGDGYLEDGNLDPVYSFTLTFRAYQTRVG